MSEHILFAPGYAELNDDEISGEVDRYVRGVYNIDSNDVEVRYESGKSSKVTADDDEPVLVLKDGDFVKATHKGKETIRDVADKIGL